MLIDEYTENKGETSRKTQPGPESCNFMGEANNEGAIGPLGSSILDDVGIFALQRSLTGVNILCSI